MDSILKAAEPTVGVPELTTAERAELAYEVMELLREIEEDGTLAVLRNNNLSQTAADLEKRATAVWEALEPLLANGANPIYVELGLEYRDEEPEDDERAPDDGEPEPPAGLEFHDGP